MMHAFISPENEILTIEDNINPDVATKPGYRWLPVIDIPRPTYNPDLQVAKPNIILNENDVTRDWTIRDKTELEIEGDKINKVNSIDPGVFKILHYTQNQIRDLDNLTPLSEQEYRDLLKDLF